jgi:hypothetical protein
MSDYEVVARFLTLNVERNGGPSPAGFEQTFDRDEVIARTSALHAYVVDYIVRHEKSAEAQVESQNDNGFTIRRTTGESLIVSCYGRDIFTLIRFPTAEEQLREKSLFHEWAHDLDTNMMIQLVRSFIMTGNFHDDAPA